MKVTNQENIREFNGQTLHIHAGGRLSAVNLHVNAIHVTVDTLATFEASLAGQNFILPGKNNVYTLVLSFGHFIWLFLSCEMFKSPVIMQKLLTTTNL